MPQQSLLRIVKRWKKYVPRKHFAEIPRMTRGFYVLYREQLGGHYEVSYIGIGGLGKKSAIGGRIKSHNTHKKDWTHFSFFEVHDNVTGDEIRELEGLLLAIFSDDSRVELSNIQTGSSKFKETRKPALWR